MEEVRFTGHGGAALVGSLHLPARGPAPVVVAVHGAGSGTRAAPLLEHLGLLPDHGVGAFVFDRRGEGASDGERDAPLSVLADDVVAAVEAVRERTGVDAGRIGLWAGVRANLRIPFHEGTSATKPSRRRAPFPRGRDVADVTEASAADHDRARGPGPERVGERFGQSSTV